MARYVLDASAVLAFVLREGLEQVDAFFRQGPRTDDWLGPLLLLPECTSVIYEQVRTGRILAEEVPDYVEDLLRLDIQETGNREQFRIAVKLAQQFGHAKAYDMQYLAAAIVENIELVTIDGGMRQAATNIKHPVRFLR